MKADDLDTIHQPTISDQDLLATLNRSYRNYYEAPSRNSKDAAEKAFNLSLELLQDRRVAVHMDGAVWKFGKKEAEGC